MWMDSVFYCSQYSQVDSNFMIKLKASIKEKNDDKNIWLLIDKRIGNETTFLIFLSACWCQVDPTYTLC